MKLHPAKLAKNARDAQGHLTWIEAHAPELARVNDWIDDGRRGTNYDAVKRGGSEGSDPEQRAVRAVVDGIGSAASRLRSELDLALRHARTARRIAEALTQIHQDDTEKRVYGPGEGDCKNCTAYVPGIANDRLRSGRCNPCRVYFDRNQSERPRELWENHGDEEAA